MDLGEQFVQMLYLGTLAIWIGSIVGMAVVVRPALFNKLPRQQASHIVSEIMLRLSVLRLATAGIIVPVALLRYVIWDRHEMSGLIGTRYVLLFIMTQIAIIGVMCAMLMRMRAFKVVAGPEGNELTSDQDRQRFRTSHGFSRGMGVFEILLGVIVLFLN